MTIKNICNFNISITEHYSNTNFEFFKLNNNFTFLLSRNISHAVKARYGSYDSSIRIHRVNDYDHKYPKKYLEKTL